MIVQIVGTNGSGKSQVIRTLMEEGRTESLRKVEGGGPAGYRLWLDSVPRSVYIPGSYSNPTGGCDTISSNVKQVFEMVRVAHEAGQHVLFEGIFVMNQTRGPELVRLLHGQFHVVLLTTPLGVCFASIADRRAERGVAAQVARRNTENNHTRARNYTARVRDVGAVVHRVNRDEAPERCWGILAGRW